MVELTLRLVFSLAVVVGLLVLAAKMGSRKFRGGRGSTVTVLHRQALSRTSSVAVVEVGQRVLVLGTTEHQVNLLTEIDAEDLALPALPAAALIDLSSHRPAEEGEEEDEHVSPDPARPASLPVATDFGQHLVTALAEDTADADGAGTPAPRTPGARRAGGARRKGGAHAAPAAKAPSRPGARAARTTTAPASGPLAGSVLSPDTWRQALAAARGLDDLLHMTTRAPRRTPSARRSRGALAAALLAPLLAALFVCFSAAPGLAAATPTTPVTSVTPATSTGATTGAVAAPVLREAGPTAPVSPSGPKGPGQDTSSDVNIKLRGIADKPSTSISVILVVTLLSLLPAIVLTCTSFTKILVVLSLTRNALGLQQTPPNQVLAGLALFLSLFIMSPVLSQVNDDGIKPYMDGTKTSAQAWHDGTKPLKGFMLDNTDDKELQLLTNVAKRDLPKDRNDVGLDTLVPAFVLSELKDAFIIGFIIFIPFLVIDIVVSGALMALGMMMMPPVMVSLPFKLLLFVLVDGWGLLIKSLVASYH